MKNYLENIDREALRARAEQMLGYANDARSQASRWTDYAVTRARGFSLFDFAIFEACLLSGSSAAYCSWRLLRAGCTCSGAYSLTATRNNLIPDYRSTAGEEHVCAGSNRAK